MSDSLVLIKANLDVVIENIEDISDSVEIDRREAENTVPFG